ncbi:MAG: response regulator transcription factor [Gammaproteobacteria bacterium]
MKTGQQQDRKTVMISTGNALLGGHYTRILEKHYRVNVTPSLEAVLEQSGQQAPALLVLDPAVIKSNLDAALAEILTTHPGIRLIVVENDSDEVLDQYILFKAGVHGFCKHDISAALLEKAVQLVLEGEYWIQRKLITQVISEIARDVNTIVSRPDGPDDTLISSLTPRELQVARMVHLGGNNKMIARELDISERTVKAHLSAIFRKLDIENRLHLALLFSGKM